MSGLSMPDNLIYFTNIPLKRKWRVNYYMDKKKEGVDWQHAEQCAKVICEANNLERTIDWKQGLAIALGVPLIILPSIGYFSSYMAAASILVWGLSVFQGFAQNTAFGELATTFPNASGLPGFTQNVFKTRNHIGKYDKGKLIGGFSAWGYWFGWAPAMAVFSLLAASYIYNIFPLISNTFTEMQVSYLFCIVIFTGLFVVNFRGLSSGATLGYILAFFAIVPLMIIAFSPFATGDFNITNITSSWLPMDWAWDFHHILILLGIFAMAQWSACAWETAAIYGPEYKNPGSDVPKALFSCGAICLFTYVIIQASIVGTLGVVKTSEETLTPLLPVAQMTFGATGSVIAIIALVTAIVLLVQTIFLGASRTMHSMAIEGNLPKIFSKVNAHGVPYVAMLFIATINIGFISLGTPVAILIASAFGYVVAQGISLFAYVKAKSDPHLAELDRPFKAPAGWKNIALIFGLLNIPLFIIGLIYLNTLEIGGWTSSLVGFGVLAVYIPIWFYSQNQFHSNR